MHNRISSIVCDCGNEKDFIKYQSRGYKTDERGRKHAYTSFGFTCGRKWCKAVLTEEELKEQLKDQMYAVKETNQEVRQNGGYAEGTPAQGV